MKLKYTCYDCCWRHSCVDHCNGCEHNECKFDELGRCLAMDKKEECSQHRAWRICRDAVRERDIKIDTLEVILQKVRDYIHRPSRVYVSYPFATGLDIIDDLIMGVLKIK